MADERSTSQDVAEQERDMREHERKAQEHAATEAGPDQRKTAEPGAPVFPAQKSPGS